MNPLFPSSSLSKDQIQSRLLTLAAFSLLFFSLILTLSPAVRFHSWAVDYRWEHWAGFLVWLISFASLHRLVSARLPERDPYLLPVIALLAGLGLLTIWRLDTEFGLRQSVWLLISVAVVAAGITQPAFLVLLRRYKYLLLISGLALTALTFAFGVYPGGEGPRLWLGCCGVYLQPSEPLKLLLIGYLAAYLADRMPTTFSFSELLAPTLFMVGASVALLVAQRDLGTTALIVALYAMTTYLASGRRRVVLISGILLVLMVFVGYQLFDVIRLRVDTWINPWADPSGRSYQIVQSLLAVASGGVFGTGPGLGSPGLVPVSHSDFITASIAEENGLLGIGALAMLFAILTLRGLHIAINAPSNYKRILTSGISVYFGIQSILIVGANLRLLPLTGVTLPFVSYGGSSLLTAFVAVGILLIISSSPDEEPAPLPEPQPFLVTGALLLLGFLAIVLTAGWWGFNQAESLQARRDNPRRTINDRYVQRGPLLDRQNNPLVITEGTPGSYARNVIYPPLGNVIGYNHPVFGQAGIEAGMDSYLRGLAGNSASLIWSTQLLYNQPPPGLAVRLSLDLNLQQTADEQLDGKTGAAVLVQAATGEILVMSSHPGFNPNTLDQDWQSLVDDPNAPLINRATQGQYPLGGAIAPFTLATALANQPELPDLPTTLSYKMEDETLSCALPVSPQSTWGEAIKSGCPGALAFLGQLVDLNEFNGLHTALGFYSPSTLETVSAEPSLPRAVESQSIAALGLSDLLVSPVQVAQAAASLSNSGQMPGLRLSIAVFTPHQGWAVFPTQAETEVFNEDIVVEATDLLAADDLPIWEMISTVPAGENEVTWYVAGTLSQWNGAPLALAILLESDDAEAAYQIGRAIIQAALPIQ